MAISRVLLLFWSWLHLFFKHSMLMARHLLLGLLSCLKYNLVMVNCCRTTTQTSKNGVLNLKTGECRRTLSPAIQSFVKDFVKSNLRSVTTQILNTGHNSMDTCKAEMGIQRAKSPKEKLSKKAGRKSDGVPAVYQETTEGAPREDQAQKTQKSPRPNHFIALQVTDSEVLENAKRVQDSIIEHSRTDLNHMKVDIRKSHITLMAMHLADSVAVNSAKECLDMSLPHISKLTNSAPINLEFEGLNVFSGGSVLFITVKPSPALQTLISLSDIVVKEMDTCGIVGAGNEFKPHMTLMKYRRKKQTKNRAKKVDKAAYKQFEKEYFGSHTISSIQLCKMEGVREDGYYIVEHEVLFDR